MRSCTRKGALQYALFIFSISFQTAKADSISVWTGGAAACPTCWSQAGNWSPTGVPNNNVSVTINAGGNQPVLDSTANGFIVDNLTLGSSASLQVANAQSLGINTANTGGTATISNAGSLSLNSSGSGTGLLLYGMNGVVNLNGAGTLILGNSTANQIIAENTGMTLNNNSTIQGAGQIITGGNSATVNNNSGGVINANQSAGLTLGGPVVNTGLLEATNGSTLTLTGAIANTGGTISAGGSGSTVSLSGASINGGTLQSGGGGFLQASGSSTLSGTIALNGVLNVANSATVTVDSTAAPVTIATGSGGGLNLNSTGSATNLALNGTNGVINLNGAGTLTLSNNANNRIYANSTGMTLNNNSTIQGAGQIGVVGNALAFNNGGVVNSNQSAGLTLNGTIGNTSGLLEATNGGTLTLGGSVNNTGSTISATGANLQLNGVNITNTGGAISVSGAGSTGQLLGSTIAGGTLQASNGAQFTQSGAYSTLSGTVALNGVLNVGNASGLMLDATGGPMTLNIGAGGGVNLNSTGSVSDLALVGTGGTVNLNGPITLSNNPNNRIYANSTGMTLNNNSTIQGAGQIGLAGNTFAFNNNANGILNANQSAVTLTLNVPTTNAGLLEATNGATLSLGGVTIGNTAGTISALGAGSIVVLDGTTVNGGTLQASGGGVFNSTGSSTLLGAVALNGPLNILNASNLNLNAAGGPMTLNIGAGGGLYLNSTGSTADLSLSGTNGTVNLNGPVTLSNNANNRIYANSTGMTLNNASTIQGAGQIGVVGQPLIFNNNGTVIANQSAGLSLGGTITNAGLLEATNGATLTFASGTLNNSNRTISATGANSSLIFNNQTVNNSGGTISTSGGAGSVTLSGTFITGGTLGSNGGGTFQVTGTSGFAEAVTLNSVLNVTNASALQLITNGGTQAVIGGTGAGLNLNSTGSVTDLVLTGTGGFVLLNAPVTLSNNANNRIYANNSGMTLLNSGTIQGAGQIGVVGQSLIFNNNGTVNANQSAGLSLSGAIANTAGLLEATNGGTLTLSGTVNNTGSTISANGANTLLNLTSAAVTNTNGIISAAGTGSSIGLNGTTIRGGTLQATGGAGLSQSGSYSTLSGTVALNGVLNVANASGLTLDASGGPMSLNIGAGGGINLNSTGNVTDLVLSGTGGTVNLNGPVTFSNSVNNRIYANGTGMTLNNSSTIQGAGQIGVVGQPLIFNNNGTVNANQSAGLSLNGTIANTAGLLEATNGGTLTLSGTVNNTGSTISANGASSLLNLINAAITNTNGVISVAGTGSSIGLNGATIRGGALQATGGGSFSQSGSYSTLSGTVALNGVLNVGNASGLTLDATGGPMSLNIGAGGGINLNSTGNVTDLALNGTGGTVNLNGPVTFSNGVNNRIYANGAGMTLNNNSTIQGAGQIGVVGNALTFNNNASGIVNSNLSAGLSLNGTYANAGLLEATNGSTLSLGSSTVNNSAGTISALGAGSVVALNGATINGGTLVSTGGGQFQSSGSTLSGTIALKGVLNVANASQVTLNATSGPMTLTGGTGAAFNVNSTGNFTDLILTGSNGTVNLNAPVTLSNSANNRIYANGTGMTLNNGGTISGAGQIGAVGNTVTFNNNASGTILANQPSVLTVGSVASFTNAGTLQTASGSTLQILGPFTNFSGNTLTGGTYFDGGIIQFNNANIVNNAANITMTGVAAEIEDQNDLNGLRGFDDNTASGDFALEGGSIFTTTAAFSNAGFLDVFANDLFSTGPASYLQTGGTTQVDGTLTANAVNIDGGTLKGSGTVNGNVAITTGGVVAPGDSPGTLTVNGSYAQSATGALDIAIAGAGAGQFGVVNVSGNASLNGTLNLSFLNGFMPLSGESFDLMNFASRTGTFSTVNGLNLGNGLTAQVDYNATDVLLVVSGTQAAPEPGTWMMFAIGMGAIGVSRLRRKG